MARYCDEDARALLELEITIRKIILSLMGEVIHTVKSFDGKVLNKRLETALKKIDKNLSVIHEYSSVRIQYYAYAHNIRSVCAGYGYLRPLNMYTYLCWCDAGRCIDGDGRIISKVFVDCLEKEIDNIENEIKNIEKHIPLVYLYRERLESIENELTGLQREIPLLIREYYGLSRYVSHR